jgi:arabinofuranosyltransferase
VQKWGKFRVFQGTIFGCVLLVQLIFVGDLVRDAVPELWESRWAQDDAYISFRYARNFVEGNGMVFNPGDRVEGYTNYLWTMLAAVPLATGVEDPLHSVHRTGRLFWFGTYVLLLVFFNDTATTEIYTAPLVAAPLLAHWSFNQWYLSGMETGMVSFFFLLVLVLFALQDGRRTAAAVLFGTSCVLLLLSRPDTVVFLIGLALAGLVCHRTWFTDREFWRRWVPPFLLPVVVVYLPYTFWRLWYYGDLLPNTYYAKAVYNPSYQRGWEYLTKYFEIFDFGPFLLVLVLAALITRDEVVRRFLVGCIFGGAMVFLYLVRLGGDFMEWRFLTPISGVLFAGIGVGFYVIGHHPLQWLLVRFEGSKNPERVWVSLPAVAAGIACALVGLFFLNQVAEAGREPAQREVIRGQETILSLEKYARPEYAWKEIGRTCRRLFPEDVKIATTAAGMIPFFARLPTLDLHGLTDREIAREPIEPDAPRRMGHDHELVNRDVMRERGVEVLLPWPRLWSFPRALALPDRPGQATASIRMTPFRFFEVIFLNPDREFVHALRGHDDVIFRDLSQVYPKEEMVENAPLREALLLVDRLDLESRNSETTHEFEEIFDPNAPYEHNYHDKVLAYLSLGEPTILRDDGRKIYHQAVWKVTGVSSQADLTMVVRHDHTVRSRYSVEVNSRRIPDSLDFPRLPESWGEISLIIPREFLRDGENHFRISRDLGIVGEAELFHMWFLQRRSEEVARNTTIN